MALNTSDQNDTIMLYLDKPRELRLTHSALKRFCALTGAKMSSLDDVIDSYDNMILMLYVMLSEDDQSITPERLDEMIAEAERRKTDRLKLATLFKQIAAAMQAALAGDDDAETIEEGADGDPMMAAGTGEEV